MMDWHRLRPFLHGMQYWWSLAALRNAQHIGADVITSNGS